MDKLLEERVARLEAWANDFSCRAEHAGAPIFTTKAYYGDVKKRLAAHHARTIQGSSTE